MKFRDTEHETYFYSILDKMQNDDCYHQSLAYLIALDGICRKHFFSIYNCSEGCIIPDCLEDEWQTSTSLKVLRLAFNLYTNGIMWTEEPTQVTPANIFCCDYSPYFYESIKLRYPEYLDNNGECL